jgi:adenylate kinase family enzyme
MIGSHGSGKAT